MSLEFHRHCCMLKDKNTFNDAINIFDNVTMLSLQWRRFITIFLAPVRCVLTFLFLNSNLDSSFKMNLHMLESNKKPVRSQFFKICFIFHVSSCLIILEKFPSYEKPKRLVVGCQENSLPRKNPGKGSGLDLGLDCMHIYH